MANTMIDETPVRADAGQVTLEGNLSIPDGAGRGAVRPRLRQRPAQPPQTSSTIKSTPAFTQTAAATAA